MQDKEKIIVNGVDVSGCEFCVVTLAEAHKLCKLEYLYKPQYKIDCEDNPNCLYKQLQAKTDECKGLRRKNTNQSIKTGDLLHIISENEHYIKVVIPEEFKEIIQENTALKQDKKILVEALEEIKENNKGHIASNGKEIRIDYIIAKTALDKVKGK